MSGKTSPAQKDPFASDFFYAESPPKKSRLHETNTLEPSFKSLKNNLIKFDRKLSEPINHTIVLKPTEEIVIGDEPRTSLDRDSPIPLKNLGNTCYENSIIQCLFSLNMFMDNFEQSIENARRFVVKPASTIPDAPTPTASRLGSEAPPPARDVSSANESTTSTLTNSAPTGSTISSLASTNATTIAEDDVRYRIANAFDKLYKSYTQKRIQSETDANNVGKTSPSPDIGTQLRSLPEQQLPSSNLAIERSTAIPLCKFSSTGQSTHTASASTCSEDNQGSASSTLPITAPPSSASGIATISSTHSVDSTTTTNLTPIALLSSAATPSEQTEIETRLEDLKSAVGERSSQFNSTHQQDASEFFYHVIDSIQEFYQSLDKSSDDDNPVTKAFELELDYLITCPKCRHRTLSEPEKIRTLPLALPHVNNEPLVNKEEFNHDTAGAPTPPTSDLGSDSPKSSTSDEQRNGSDEKENLALVDHNAPEDYSSNTKSIAKLDLADKPESNMPTAQKQYTLCDALNNYFKDDLLEYSCSQSDCDSKQRTKKCLIRKLPQVLFITLARYSYTGKKNLDEVEAPFELTVPFQENKSPSHSPSAHRDFNNDNDNMYQLVAVVCHLGSSLNAGHYTSYVYNQNNFSWYSCDDDSITKVPESEVKTDARRSGYCFFYAHRSCIAKPSRPLELEQIESAPKRNVEETHDEVQVIEHQPQLITSDLEMESSSQAATSSAILTPDPSPKSSPSPIPSNHEATNLHDDHSVCKNGTIDMTIDDDWS